MPKRIRPEAGYDLPEDLGIHNSETFSRFGYLASDIHPNSAKKVVATCTRCKVLYERKRLQLALNTHCVGCRTKKETAEVSLTNIDDSETFRRFGYLATSVHSSSMKEVAYTCSACKEVHTRYRRRLTQDAICKSCSVSRSRTPEVVAKMMTTLIERYGGYPNNYGKAEKGIAEWVQSMGIQCNSQLPLPTGKRIDLVIPERKLAIEYCGLFWHNEKSPSPRGRHYHELKMRETQEAGYRLITLFEDEWLLRRPQSEGLLKSILGIHDFRVGARECTVSEVEPSSIRRYMEDTHLQGGSNRACKAFSLTHQDKILGALTLAKHHRHTNENILVIDRIAFTPGTQVPGGASRLIEKAKTAARELGATKLVTWSDNRWSTGNLYSTVGFTKEADLPPDYSYVVLAKPRERLSKQSQRKSAVDCPEGKTELEWATERGLARIWDCGHIRWSLTL